MSSDAQSAGPSVLVIDDESGILDTLRILLKGEGFAPHTALGGKAGLDKIESLSPDIILTDVRMPNVTGVDILAAARQKDPDTPVILMTAQATLQSAMQAVNQGAFYYLQKPFRNDELVAILRRAAEHRSLRVENKSLKQEIRRREGFSRPVGKSRSWIDVIKLAETVAPTESTVLIQGESGTGKEVIARYIHELSGRQGGPFLSINCGALPESLLESELFGHVKGSFTGAVKDKSGLFTAGAGGTFFLDEIGETTPATQVKLLRVLQHREVIPVGATEAQPIDTRILAATNRDLEEEIRRGNFRSDLFYRLNVIAIHLPPLRERRDDIPLLVESFLARSGAARGEQPKHLSDEAAEILNEYSWPGNVRELENALERAVILSGDAEEIPLSALPAKVSERRSEPFVQDREHHNPTLDTIERAYILWVLQSEGGDANRGRPRDRSQYPPSEACQARGRRQELGYWRIIEFDPTFPPHETTCLHTHRAAGGSRDHRHSCGDRGSEVLQLQASGLRCGDEGGSPQPGVRAGDLQSGFRLLHGCNQPEHEVLDAINRRQRRCRERQCLWLERQGHPSRHGRHLHHVGGRQGSGNRNGRRAGLPVARLHQSQGATTHAFRSASPGYLSGPRLV
jgi:DNA-binding NtrC family response regulator